MVVPVWEQTAPNAACTSVPFSIFLPSLHASSPAHALSNAAILSIELAPAGVQGALARHSVLLGLFACLPLTVGLWLARRD